MGIAIIIPIFLAIVAAAFWLGGFNERISFVDRISKIEQRLGKLEDKKSTEKESSQNEDKSSPKANSKNLPEQKVINK